MTDLAAFQAYAAAMEPGQAWPVAQWHPPFCGDIDMRIARDGTWFYNGSQIQRPAMVQLFARLLRRDGERYFLVTPIEKVGITVEDVPFIAVEMTVTDDPIQTLTFRTNVGDVITANADHPLRLETDLAGGFIPYVEVRDRLFARLSRELARNLAALGDVITCDDQDGFCVKSAGSVFHVHPTPPQTE